MLVSHDRALLDAIGTRTVAFEDRELHSYVGGWAEYVRLRDEQAKSPVPSAPAPPAGSASPRAGSRRQPPTRAQPGRKRSAPARQATASANGQHRLEQQIEAAEAALRTLEDDLADPSAWSTAEASARSSASHDAAKRAVEKLYERWEATAG